MEAIAGFIAGGLIGYLFGRRGIARAAYQRGFTEATAIWRKWVLNAPK